MANNLSRGISVLTNYRHVQGLTQDQLGELLEITASYVSLIECGKRQPGHKLARRIEERCGIPKSRLRPDLWS